MKKLWQKLLCVVLALMVCVPVVACSGGNDGGGTTNQVKINIEFNRGGVYSTWVKNYFKQYEDEVKNKAFGTHTGVKISYTDVTVSNDNYAQQSNTNIFMDGGQVGREFYSRVNKGYYLAIDDVVTGANPYNEDGSSIESYLITDEEQPGIQSMYYIHKDGDVEGQKNYFALPWKEYYAGVTYDATMFNEYGFYFAKSSEYGSEYTGFTAFGNSYYFVEGEADPNYRSVGVDGIAGTVDDGLPTSLEEYMALCSYIKSKNIYPFISTNGTHIDYTNFLLTPIIAGLEGENFSTYFSCDGEVEVVNGYEDENLWGMTDVFVPKTKKVTIDPDDKTTWGYLSQTVARYYALAFMKYASLADQDWIFTGTASSTNIQTQEYFVNCNTPGEQSANATKRAAMICEGSFWYTEANDNGTFDSFDFYVGAENRKDFGLLPYVTKVKGTVAEGEGAKTVITPCEPGAAVWINNNLMEKPVENADLILACKDFIQWLFSKKQLLNYTEITGQIMGGYNYDWQSLVYEKDGSDNYLDGLEGRDRVIKSDSKLSSYQISCLELRRDSSLIIQAPNENNTTIFITFGLDATHFKLNNSCVYQNFKNGSKTVRQFFEDTFIVLNG